MVRWLAGYGEGGKKIEGVEEAADTLMKAIENVTAEGVKTRDLGGSSSTKEVTEAICKEIEKLQRS